MLPLPDVPLSQPRQLPAVWLRPSPGSFKINFNAAVTQSGKAGFDFIACDCHGEVLAPACCLFGPVLSPSVAVALCFRWALGLARNFCFRRVVFEIDCMVLFEAWNREDDFFVLDSLVVDCRSLISCFDVFNFLFVRQSGNCVADDLSSLSFSLGEVVWIEEVPHQLIGVVQSNVLASVPPVSFKKKKLRWVLVMG
ncbi:uncharacterized protein LOC130719659 [Lotus japonicus]|uniref:uncharacterized protein LOC130719659 n=1 Tax=Lotus japonicus TaxID=34305 RepID=UPI0025849263|nr:uncharacterized protein LOC130719659 [Lotus japonicus]